MNSPLVANIEKIYSKNTNTYEYVLRASARFSIPAGTVAPIDEGFIYEELKRRLISDVNLCCTYQINKMESQE